MPNGRRGAPYYYAESPVLIDLVVETDSAQAVSAGTIHAIEQVTEVDLSQSVLPLGEVSQVSELDLSQAVDGLKTLSVEQAQESDSLIALSSEKTVLLEQVVEVDQANEVPPSRVIAQVTETDLAQALVPAGVIVAQATETDISQAISGLKIAEIGQPSESDLPQELLSAKNITLGQVIETDQANAITRAELIIEQVNETDTSQAITLLGKPTPPTGLIAVEAPVRLSWIPSISVGVSEQRIYRATVSGGSYVLIDTIGNNTTSTYTDTNATEFTHYYYVVRAYNGNESVNSNEANACGSDFVLVSPCTIG